MRGIDTLAGEPLTIEADLVVLAAAMRPADRVEELAQKLNVGYDENGFLSESHPKLRPVETNAAGVFVCGACQGPKDIPESVAQASAVAGKVLIMFSREQLSREPEIAIINENNCAACFACVRTCPYNAIEKAEIRDRKGNLVKRTARVNQGLCMGCGTCWPCAPRRAPTSKASPSSKSTQWWRASNERKLPSPAAGEGPGVRAGNISYNKIK